MAFDPGEFLGAARSLLKVPGNEAVFRAVGGRAYYAVYGTMRARLCGAKDVSPKELFGQAGRHGDVIKALDRGAPRFKSLVHQYASLHFVRVKCDYRYDERVTLRDARRAPRGCRMGRREAGQHLGHGLQDAPAGTSSTPVTISPTVP